jgi:hypothetical protein
MTAPQTQPPADIGEMVERPFVERLLALCSLPGGDGMVRVNANDLRDTLTALLTDRDELVRKLHNHGICEKCGGLHYGMAGNCMGPPGPSSPPPHKMIA